MTFPELTREQVEMVRASLLDSEWCGFSKRKTVNTLCDLAIAALSLPTLPAAEGWVSVKERRLQAFIDAVGALTDAEGKLSCIHPGPERDELQQVYDGVDPDDIAMPFSGSIERKV